MNKYIPKNYKFKKIRKRVRISKLQDFRRNTLKVGNFGLKILTNGTISAIVLEAARRSITRKIKRTGQLKVNGFSNIPVTAKALGIRMGKGSGSIENWVYPVRRGRILFELKGVSLDIAKSALRSASYKIPLKSKFIYE